MDNQGNQENQNNQNNQRRLYRSTKDVKIAGVCGGVAEFLNIDPTIVRLLAVLSALMGGLGLGAYIIAAIIIPQEPN